METKGRQARKEHFRAWSSSGRCIRSFLVLLVSGRGPNKPTRTNVTAFKFSRRDCRKCLLQLGLPANSDKGSVCGMVLEKWRRLLHRAKFSTFFLHEVTFEWGKHFFFQLSDLFFVLLLWYSSLTFFYLWLEYNILRTRRFGDSLISELEVNRGVYSV